MKKLIILILLTIFLAVSTVNAQPTPTPTLPVGQIARISAELGENYIQWSWVGINSSTVLPTKIDIYLDNSQTPIAINYSGTSYLVENLHADERHIISIYANNSSTLVGKATVLTLHPAYEIYFLIGIGIILVLVVFSIQDIIRLVLVGLFNIILSIFAFLLANGYGMIQYIFMAIIIITAIILIYVGLPKLREEIDWM